MATKHLSNQVHYSISDTATMGHFLVKGTVTITLPIGGTVQSTHTCNLDIPWLPYYVTNAHLIPDLAHVSLISTRKFYSAGCYVALNGDKCHVFYNEKLVLVGG